MTITMTHLPLDLFTMQWEPSWTDSPQGLTVDISIEDFWRDGRAEAARLNSAA